MVDNLITVAARWIRQFKSCQITAKIDYINLKQSIVAIVPTN
jgi:hypothetical protein